jgi:hypothetical protein
MRNVHRQSAVRFSEKRELGAHSAGTGCEAWLKEAPSLALQASMIFTSFDGLERPSYMGGARAPFGDAVAGKEARKNFGKLRICYPLSARGTRRKCSVGRPFQAVRSGSDASLTAWKGRLTEL